MIKNVAARKQQQREKNNKKIDPTWCCYILAYIYAACTDVVYEFEAISHT